VPRDRVLSGDEIGLVWRATDAVPSPYGAMIRFAMLTLARREEVAAMTWGEMAPDLSAWTLPLARSKNRKPHRVHLSEPARAIMRTLLSAEEGKPLPPLPKADRLVFALPAGKRITSHSWVKRQIDAAMTADREKAADVRAGDLAPLAPWVLHDFRRTGVTVLADQGFPPHVADRLLNHAQGTIRGVAAIYQKGEFAEERKRALDGWAAHVLACAEGLSPARKVEVLAEHRRTAREHRRA
jgi:integrase